MQFTCFCTILYHLVSVKFAIGNLVVFFSLAASVNNEKYELRNTVFVSERCNLLGGNLIYLDTVGARINEDFAPSGVATVSYRLLALKLLHQAFVWSVLIIML